jgi:acyl transferase domain-containing protein/acyl carrier protein
LRALAQRWAAAPGVEGAGLADRCFSANTGRARLAERLAVFAADAAGMLAALNDWLAGRPGAWQAGTVPHGRPPRIAFLFTGQGAQYVGMGRELYETQPGFRRDMDECNDLLQGSLGNSLIDLLYRAEGEAAEERLAHTEITQPILFALEYSLARLWMRWGVQPAALLGHSIGEYVAATLAGVFSLADGLRLVAARARLMHAAPGDGAMVSVVADEGQCLAALAGFENQVVIGVYNGPRNHVLSGERAALDRVVERLVAQGIEARPLKVSHAFHSPLMDTVLEDFAAVANDMQFRPASISVYSNISGSALEGATMDAAYWVAQLRSPVRFAEGVRALQSAGIDAYIEIGPRPTLLSLAQQSVEEAEALWLPSLRPRTGDTRQILDSLAKLYLRGAAVDWRGFDRDWPRRRLPLPTYPFQRRRYWLPPVPKKGRAADAELTAFPGRRLASPLLDQILFENRYDTRTLPWLGEHRVFEQVVVPGAAHLSLVLQAAESFFGASPCVLQDVIFPQALVVPEPGARRIQLSIAREPGKDGRSFTLISLPAEGDEGWEEHASGRLSALDAVDAAQSLSELADLQGQCAQGLSARFYEEIWQSAIDLGPRFRWVEALWRGENQILARLIRPAQAADDVFRLHPGLIDSALQVLAAAVVKQPGDALVPFSIEQFRWFAPVTATELWSHVRLRPDESTRDDVLSDVRLYAADGRLIAEARGFRARRVASRNLIRESLDGLEEALYALRWEEAALPACAPSGTWLVVGEAAAATQWLAGYISAQATESASLVCLQANFGTGPAGQDAPLLLPLDNALALAQSLRGLGKLDGIVLLAGMEAELPAVDVAVAACSRVLHLVQAVVSQGGAVPHLVLATHGAQVGAGLPVVQGTGQDLIRADQAALWGLAKVVRLEHPELKCTCVDLRDGEASFPALARLLGQTNEADLILSDGRQWLPKLDRYKLKSRQAPALRDDAAYLISGGLGALGLQLAEWLARHGARHLILIGRRLPSAEAAAATEALTGQGVKVTTYALDIADPNALAAVLAPKDASAAAIAGVFHLAGVLDDGMLQQQDRGRFAGVFAPKLGGALNLHQAFAGVALDHFVCFSSVAGLTGSMGQGSYAAANAALDALMAARRAAGLPGLSLQWGPWADAGMAAMQDEKDQQRFAGYGIDPINTNAGMNLLGHLLGQQVADSAAFPASVAVLSVHWPTYLGQLYGGSAFPSMYRSLGEALPAPASAVRTASTSGLVERLGEAAPGERRALLETYLRETIAGVMGLADPGVITPRQRLFELGLDSLGAVELRNWLAAAMGRTLRATLIFDYPTLVALADHLEQDVLGFKSESEAAPAVEADAATEQLDSLSDDELAKLLADELGA